MFIPCIDISTELQKDEQAGQPLQLLTGQIQRTALMDLPSYIYITHTMLQKDKHENKRGHKSSRVASPCLSFQRLLRAWPAASPCLVCSSELPYGEGYSRTLGLDRKTEMNIKQMESLSH